MLCMIVMVGQLLPSHGNPVHTLHTDLHVSNGNGMTKPSMNGVDTSMPDPDTKVKILTEVCFE